MSNYPTFAELNSSTPDNPRGMTGRPGNPPPQASDYEPAREPGQPPATPVAPQAGSPPISFTQQQPQEEQYVSRKGGEISDRQGIIQRGGGNGVATIPSPQISAPSKAGRFPTYAELNPEMMGPPKSAKGGMGYTMAEGIDVPPDIAGQEQDLAPANAKLAITAAATLATLPFGGEGGPATEGIYATGRFSMARLTAMLRADAEAAGPAARVGPFQEWGRTVEQLSQSPAGNTLTSIINNPFINKALKLTAVGLIAKGLFPDSAAGFVRYLIHRGIFEAASKAGAAVAAGAAASQAGE